MKTINLYKKFVITLLSTCLLSQGGVMAQTQSQAKVILNDAALRTFKVEVTKSGEQLFEDEENYGNQFYDDLNTASDASAEFVRKIDDTSIPLKDIQKELIQKIQSEEEAQIKEIRMYLTKMDMETIDKIFYTAIEKGQYDYNTQFEYDIAYTEAEKRLLLLKLISADLNQAKSKMLFRIGKLSREQLRQEFELTQTMLNNSINMKSNKFFGYGDGKKRYKAIIITVLTVAAAGLATWAIISKTKERYEKKLEKKKKEYADKTEQMYADYDRLTEELKQNHTTELERIIAEHEALMSEVTQDFANDEAALREVFASREELRESGYTWKVCNVQENVKSTTCSYDGNSYSGVERCVSHCLVSPEGREIGQTSLVCTNSNIPYNCSTPNPTVQGETNGDLDGYFDGYDYGYDNAYSTAYDRAYDDLYSDGYYDGDSDGYADGYDEGYMDGYHAGLSDGEYDSTMDYNDGYDAGYADGYDYATLFY